MSANTKVIEAYVVIDDHGYLFIVDADLFAFYTFEDLGVVKVGYRFRGKKEIHWL